MQLTSAAAAIASVIAVPVSLAGDGFADWADLPELDASSDLSVDLAPVGMATPLFTMVQYGPDKSSRDVAGDGDGGLEVKLILDLLPGGFLISPDLDGFTVDGGFFTETIDGVGSGVLTLGIGVAFDTSMISWDLEFGGDSR